MHVEKSSDERLQELTSLLDAASRAQTVDELRDVVVALIKAQIAASDAADWDMPIASTR